MCGSPAVGQLPTWSHAKQGFRGTAGRPQTKFAEILRDLPAKDRHLRLSHVYAVRGMAFANLLTYQAADAAVYLLDNSNTEIPMLKFTKDSQPNIHNALARAGKVKYALLGWLFGAPTIVIIFLLFFRGCDF